MDYGDPEDEAHDRANRRAARGAAVGRAVARVMRVTAFAWSVSFGVAAVISWAALFGRTGPASLWVVLLTHALGVPLGVAAAVVSLVGHLRQRDPALAFAAFAWGAALGLYGAGFAWLVIGLATMPRG